MESQTLNGSRTIPTAPDVRGEVDPAFQLPLVDSITFRASRPMSVHLRRRALVEGADTSALIRRLIRLGAQAEGWDVEDLLSL